MSYSKYLFRHLFILIFSLLLILYQGKISADSTPRTIISLYHYDGVEDDSKRNKFGQYKGIIKRRITRIAEQLGNRGKEYEYLRKLSTHETNQKAGSVDNRALIWESTNTLQLLSGVVFDHNDSITVMTEVYLGLLSKHLNHTLVEIELNVSPDEYRKTRDIYSALTLYSILMDAVDKQPPHVVSYFLSETNNHIKDLDQQAPLTMELNNAIKEVTHILRSRAITKQ